MSNYVSHCYWFPAGMEDASSLPFQMGLKVLPSTKPSKPNPKTQHHWAQWSHVSTDQLLLSVPLTCMIDFYTIKMGFALLREVTSMKYDGLQHGHWDSWWSYVFRCFWDDAEQQVKADEGTLQKHISLWTSSCQVHHTGQLYWLPHNSLHLPPNNTGITNIYFLQVDQLLSRTTHFNIKCIKHCWKPTSLYFTLSAAFLSTFFFPLIH